MSGYLRIRGDYRLQNIVDRLSGVFAAAGITEQHVPVTHNDRYIAADIQDLLLSMDDDLKVDIDVWAAPYIAAAIQAVAGGDEGGGVHLGRGVQQPLRRRHGVM